MLDLIERLERATGPDRQLDRMIEETLPGVLRHPYAWQVKEGYVISGDGHQSFSPGQGYLPPPYTREVEAALKLVPEGHVVSLRSYSDDVWRGAVRRLDDISGEWFLGGDKANPATTLCIAAMKSRVALTSAE